MLRADPAVNKQSPLQSLQTFVGSFHLRMAAAMLVFTLVAFGGCLLTGIELPGLGQSLIIALVIAAMLLPLPLYWYEKNRGDLLDSSLLALWALLEALVIPFLVRAAARSRLPLQDHLLGTADRYFHVNVAALVAWSQHHWVGYLINHSYSWVNILMPVAVLLPIFAKKLRYAQRFVVANLVSFAIGIPLFALLPAIGPWIYYHFAPTQPQFELCEVPLLEIRLPGAYVLHSQSPGIVCFPSFHVVWAVLVAASLWGFRYLRIPAVLICTMIILSTMTTGWHYFVDVLGGLIIAAPSLLIAHAVVSPATHPSLSDDASR